MPASARYQPPRPTDDGASWQEPKPEAPPFVPAIGATPTSLIPFPSPAYGMVITSARLQVFCYVLAELSSASTTLPDYTRARLNLSHRLLAAWQAVMTAAVAAHRRDEELARFADGAAWARWRRRARARARQTASTTHARQRTAAQMRSTEELSTAGQTPAEALPPRASGSLPSTLPRWRTRRERKGSRTEGSLPGTGPVRAPTVADTPTPSTRESGGAGGSLDGTSESEVSICSCHTPPRSPYRVGHHAGSPRHRPDDGRRDGHGPWNDRFNSRLVNEEAVEAVESMRPPVTGKESASLPKGPRLRRRSLPPPRMRGLITRITRASRMLRMAIVDARAREDAVARHVETVRALTVAALFQHYLHVFVEESVHDSVLARWLRPASRAEVERVETARIAAAIARAYGELTRTHRHRPCPSPNPPQAARARGSRAVSPRTSSAPAPLVDGPTWTARPREDDRSRHAATHPAAAGRGGLAMRDERFPFQAPPVADGAVCEREPTPPATSPLPLEELVDSPQRRLGSSLRSCLDPRVPRRRPSPPALDSHDTERSPGGSVCVVGSSAGGHSTQPLCLPSSRRWGEQRGRGRTSPRRFVELSDSDSDENLRQTARAAGGSSGKKGVSVEGSQRARGGERSLSPTLSAEGGGGGERRGGEASVRPRGPSTAPDPRRSTPLRASWTFSHSTLTTPRTRGPASVCGSSDVNGTTTTTATSTDDGPPLHRPRATAAAASEVSSVVPPIPLQAFMRRAASLSPTVSALGLMTRCVVRAPRVCGGGGAAAATGSARHGEADGHTPLSSPTHALSQRGDARASSASDSASSYSDPAAAAAAAAPGHRAGHEARSPAEPRRSFKRGRCADNDSTPEEEEEGEGYYVVVTTPRVVGGCHHTRTCFGNRTFIFLPRPRPTVPSGEGSDRTVVDGEGSEGSDPVDDVAGVDEEADGTGGEESLSPPLAHDSVSPWTKRERREVDGAERDRPLPSRSLPVDCAGRRSSATTCVHPDIARPPSSFADPPCLPALLSYESNPHSPFPPPPLPAGALGDAQLPSSASCLSPSTAVHTAAPSPLPPPHQSRTGSADHDSLPLANAFSAVSDLSSARGTPLTSSVVAYTGDGDGLVLTLRQHRRRGPRAGPPVRSPVGRRSCRARGPCPDRRLLSPGWVVDGGAHSTSSGGACDEPVGGAVRGKGCSRSDSDGDAVCTAHELAELNAVRYRHRRVVVVYATQCSATLRHARRWGDPYASSSEDEGAGEQWGRCRGRLLLDRHGPASGDGCVAPCNALAPTAHATGGGERGGAAVHVGSSGGLTFPPPPLLAPEPWAPPPLTSFEQAITQPPAAGQDVAASTAQRGRGGRQGEVWAADLNRKSDTGVTSAPGSLAAAAEPHPIVPSDGDLAYAQELCARLQFWCLRGQVRDAFVDASHLSPRPSASDTAERKGGDEPWVCSDERGNEQAPSLARGSVHTCARHEPRVGVPPTSPLPAAPALATTTPTPTSAAFPSPIQLPLKLLNADVGFITFSTAGLAEGGPVTGRGMGVGRKASVASEVTALTPPPMRAGEDSPGELAAAAVNARGRALLREALLASTEAVVIAARESRAHSGFHDRLHCTARRVEANGTLSDDDANPYVFDRHEHLEVNAWVQWLQGEQPPVQRLAAAAAGRSGRASQTVVPGARLGPDVPATTAATATDAVVRPAVDHCGAAAPPPSPPPRRARSSSLSSAPPRPPLPPMEEHQCRVERLRSEFRLARSARLDVMLVHAAHGKAIATLTLTPDPRRDHHCHLSGPGECPTAAAAAVAQEVVRATTFTVSSLSHYMAPLWRHLREEKAILVDMDRTLVDNAVTLPAALVRRRVSEARRRAAAAAASARASSSTSGDDGGGGDGGAGVDAGEHPCSTGELGGLSALTAAAVHTAAGLRCDGDATVLSFLATPLLPPRAPEAVYFEARVPLCYPSRRSSDTAAPAAPASMTAVPNPLSDPVRVAASGDPVEARDTVICSEVLFIRPGLRQLLHRMAVQWGIPVILATKSIRERAEAVLARGLDPHHLLFPDRRWYVVTAAELAAMAVGMAGEGRGGSGCGAPVSDGAVRDPLKSARMILARYDGLSVDASRAARVERCGGGGEGSRCRARRAAPFSPLHPSVVHDGHRRHRLFSPSRGKARGLAIIDDSPQVWSTVDWPATVPIAPYTLDRVDPAEYLSDNGHIASLALSCLFSSSSVTCPYGSGDVAASGASDGGGRADEGASTPARRPVRWPHCCCCCPTPPHTQVPTKGTSPPHGRPDGRGGGRGVAGGPPRVWEATAGRTSRGDGSSGSDPSSNVCPTPSSSVEFASGSTSASVSTSPSPPSTATPSPRKTVLHTSPREWLTGPPMDFATSTAARIAARAADPLFGQSSPPATPSSFVVGLAARGEAHGRARECAGGLAGVGEGRRAVAGRTAAHVITGGVVEEEDSHEEDSVEEEGEVRGAGGVGESGADGWTGATSGDAQQRPRVRVTCVVGSPSRARYREEDVEEVLLPSSTDPAVAPLGGSGTGGGCAAAGAGVAGSSVVVANTARRVESCEEIEDVTPL